VLPLDQWVFTTEAQPILRRKYIMRTLRRLEKEKKLKMEMEKEEECEL
jgi:hypothetical protein